MKCLNVAIFLYAVATLAFEMESYVISEAVLTLTPYIIILDSDLPDGTNITVNVSSASGSALGML